MTDAYAHQARPEPLIDRAAAFAFAAHTAAGQRRKYTGAPYIEHPEAVARIVRCSLGSDDMIAAAWLHDVVEDTPITLADIAAHFSSGVVTLVDWMTDKTVLADGNRAKRKAMARDRWAKAPADAQTIKLADAIDNARDITQHDPNFAKVYLAEMRLLLPVLSAGHAGLQRQLAEILV